MNKKKYINVKISVSEENFESAYGIISDYKILGIEEKYDEITITFDSNHWNESTKQSLIKNLTKLDPDIKILNIDIVEEKNWNAEFEKNSHTVIINEKIGIAPEWKIDKLSTEIKIIINPKMSFGTGEHETTQMMCKLMENNIKKGSTWIDAGCGSGILSILAIKLGAKDVFAFDNDSWAVENTYENIKLNGLKNQISISQDSVKNINLPPADGILANMFLNLIISSLDKFKNSLKRSSGNLILSGILKYDENIIIKELKTHRFSVLEKLTDNEWIALNCTLPKEEIL
jgi:ribosomal protein L11 methyltransferase